MKALESPHPESLLAYLQKVPDPRSRHGRIYPLAPLLALLVVAAFNGESSLRGMWLWVKNRWVQFEEEMGPLGLKRWPSLSGLWTILSRLDPAALEGALGEWVQAGFGKEFQGVAMDGKELRGSKRRGEEAPALKVVEAYAHQIGAALGQVVAPGGDEVKAALTLVGQIPWAGRVASLDAGLTQKVVLEKVLKRGGDYVGIVKGNHGEVKEAIDLWVAEEVFSPRGLAPLGEGGEGTWPPGTARGMDSSSGRVGTISGGGVRCERGSTGGLGAILPRDARERGMAWGRREKELDQQPEA